MASAQVVETSVTNNSRSQDSYHPDDLFQSRCDNFITKRDSFLLQSATSVITKCDKCYYKVRQVLQSVTIYYKVRQGLQSATIITKCDSTHLLFFISVHFFTVHGFTENVRIQAQI